MSSPLLSRRSGGVFFFHVEFKWKHMWSPDQVWRAATSGPLHLSLSHNYTTQTGLWQLIWTPPDPSLLLSMSVSHKAEGKRKSKADRTDSYHTGWCAAVVSQDGVRLRLGFSAELKAVHQRKKVVICNFGEKGSSIKGYLWWGFHLRDQ